MKKYTILFTILLNAVCCVGIVAQNAYDDMMKRGVDPLTGEILMADPTIFFSDGFYYMSGTDDKGGADAFLLFRSNDLKLWEQVGTALKKGDHTFGKWGFWAPQFYPFDNKWWILYTADEHIAIAEAESLSTPFMQKSIEPVDNSCNNIDPFLFKDDDGKFYIYHVRINHGNFLWVAEFDMMTRKIKNETLTKCFDLSQNWENIENSSYPVMEGPTVIKYKSKYYLFYSTNDFRSQNYAVGYAVADSPFGPWRKAEHNPIINKDIVGECGPGHGDVFVDNNGRLFYVFHVHYNDGKPVPRRTRIIPLIIDGFDQDDNAIFKVDMENIIIPLCK